MGVLKSGRVNRKHVMFPASPRSFVSLTLLRLTWRKSKASQVVKQLVEPAWLRFGILLPAQTQQGGVGLPKIEKGRQTAAFYTRYADRKSGGL